MKNVLTWNYIAVQLYSRIKIIKGRTVIASLKD
ncbi:hypothetical protein [Flavobacterium sp. ACAM 123]